MTAYANRLQELKSAKETELVTTLANDFFTNHPLSFRNVENDPGFMTTEITPNPIRRRLQLRPAIQNDFFIVGG